tara:strand:- start:70 stop:327 length:258 start_codon:yes stop_codon:yes gene_type:complete
MLKYKFIIGYIIFGTLCTVLFDYVNKNVEANENMPEPELGDIGEEFEEDVLDEDDQSTFDKILNHWHWILAFILMYILQILTLMK